MTMNDPWDWSEKQQQVQVVAPLSNVVTPLPASNERGDPTQILTMQPTQAELQAERDNQQMRSMAINKGAEKGGEYLYNKVIKPPLATPAPVEIVPVVEQSVLSSYPTVATSAGSLAGVGTQAIAPMAVEASVAPLASTAAAGAEAGALAGMGPIGWGIGALMLAKSMKWI